MTIEEEWRNARLALEGELLARGDTIAYQWAALADLRRCVTDYLDGGAKPGSVLEAELYAALRRSAAVLRGDRGVAFPEATT